MRVLQAFWARIVNRGRVPHLLRTLPRAAQICAGHKLGWKNVMSLHSPDAAYVLDLRRPDDADVAAKLFRMGADVRGRCVNNLFVNGMRHRSFCSRRNDASRSICQRPKPCASICCCLRGSAPMQSVLHGVASCSNCCACTPAGAPHVIKEENYMLYGVVEEKALKGTAAVVAFVLLDNPLACAVQPQHQCGSCAADRVAAAAARRGRAAKPRVKALSEGCRRSEAHCRWCSALAQQVWGRQGCCAG